MVNFSRAIRLFSREISNFANQGNPWPLKEGADSDIVFTLIIWRIKNIETLLPSATVYHNRKKKHYLQ